MITVRDLFGSYWTHPDATPERIEAADDMLSKVNALLLEAEAQAVYSWAVNPSTGTAVSGTGNGGFRPHDCSVGAWNSAHKDGRAVDVYDPSNRLDAFLTDELLARFGLYREAPHATIGWVHLTDRAPRSGNRTFEP